MKKLFTLALEQLLQKELGMTRETENLTKNILLKYKYDFTYSKFTRLPSNQLQTMMKVPCPTAYDKDQSSQIVIFKRLRHYFNVNEQSVCLKCAKNCPFRSIDFKSMPEKPTTNNKSALHDLLFYLISLSQQEEDVFSVLRWGSAYKSVLALSVFMQDLQNVSKEAFLYRELVKQEEYEQKKKLTQKDKLAKQLEETKKSLASRKIIL